VYSIRQRRPRTQTFSRGGASPSSSTQLSRDLLTFAGHKFHGPKGIGALWIRRGTRIRPVIQGAQELGRRGGTENTPAIIGLGVAATEARQWLADDANRADADARRDHFEQSLLQCVQGACINAANAPLGRVWSASNVAFEGVEAEALLLALSERALCASAGSACSSGSVDPSPVLRAAGVDPKLAASSIRFSFCRHTTRQNMDDAIRIIAECTQTLRQALPAAS
jgi:cysteine desulfurase